MKDVELKDYYAGIVMNNLVGNMKKMSLTYDDIAEISYGLSEVMCEQNKHSNYDYEFIRQFNIDFWNYIISTNDRNELPMFVFDGAYFYNLDSLFIYIEEVVIDIVENNCNIEITGRFKTIRGFLNKNPLEISKINNVVEKKISEITKIVRVRKFNF